MRYKPCSTWVTATEIKSISISSSALIEPTKDGLQGQHSPLSDAVIAAVILGNVSSDHTGPCLLVTKMYCQWWQLLGKIVLWLKTCAIQKCYCVPCICYILCVKRNRTHYFKRVACILKDPLFIWIAKHKSLAPFPGCLGPYSVLFNFRFFLRQMTSFIHEMVYSDISLSASVIIINLLIVSFSHLCSLVVFH